jgi:hypothetical protein
MFATAVTPVALAAIGDLAMTEMAGAHRLTLVSPEVHSKAPSISNFETIPLSSALGHFFLFNSQ